MASYLDMSPAEIQLSILCHLDSVETLFALLRASLRLLKVYQMNRDVVYSRIVYNQITPDFVSIAITTLKLRNMKPKVNLSAFIQTFHHPSTHLEISVTQWKQLLQFQRIVNETIQYSVENGLRLLAPAASAEDLHNVVLSNSERYRLLRATYNRELLVSIGEHYLSTITVDSSEDEEGTEDTEELSTAGDAEGYLEVLHSFLNTWALYEFEEVSFINHHLRERLIHCRDWAEDDRFAEWKAHGPYETRYVFEDTTQWVWSAIGRDSIHTSWLANNVFGEDLAAIHGIVTEPSQIARIRYFEQQHDLRGEEHWKQIRTQMRHDRTLKASQLMSPLLPSGWESCPLPQLDWDSYRFDEVSDGPNFGLLWVCRMSSTNTRRTRPNFDLLDQTIPWGAAIWDSARLQAMKVLNEHPGNVTHRVGGNGDFAKIDEGTGGVEFRAWKVEKEWIAKGLMKDTYRPDLAYYPYCFNCFVDVRDTQKPPPQIPHTTEASLGAAIEQSKSAVSCPECGGHDLTRRAMHE